MRRRRSIGLDRVGLPVGATQELEGHIDTLTRRLLKLAPDFPLTRDEVELCWAPAPVIEQMRAAAQYAPMRFSTVGQCTLMVHDETSAKHAFKWAVVPQSNDYGYGSAKERQAGFMIPEKQPEGYLMPDAYRDRLRAWARAHYMVGLEAGTARRFVYDFLRLCRSPGQVKKLWPELMEYSNGEDVRALRSKLSANECQRARTPEGWDDRWEMGLAVTKQILSKCALLDGADYNTPAVTAEVRAQGLPSNRAKWNDQPIAVL